VRETPEAPVAGLVDHLVARICIGLAGAVIHLDEEASRAAAEKIRAVQVALALLRKESHMSAWFSALQRLSEHKALHPLLEGVCVRMLFDQGVIPVSRMAEHMAFALSVGRPVQASASWLEGFLSGSGLLLIHHAGLWGILDGWVKTLGGAEFLQLLPVLRRTFSRFSAAERARMLAIARQVPQAALLPAASGAAALDIRRAEKAVPVLVRLLGA
jgi:hypothetical protein